MLEVLDSGQFEIAHKLTIAANNAAIMAILLVGSTEKGANRLSHRQVQDGCLRHPSWTVMRKE